MAIGSLITAASGLIGVILAKCRCVYRRQDGECQPACGFSDKPLERENNSLEIHHDKLEDLEIIVLSKKNRLKGNGDFQCAEDLRGQSAEDPKQQEHVRF